MMQSFFLYLQHQRIGTGDHGKHVAREQVELELKWLPSTVWKLMEQASF